jgi:hypothetical protein
VQSLLSPRDDDVPLEQIEVIDSVAGVGAASWSASRLLFLMALSRQATLAAWRLLTSSRHFE